MKLIWLALAVSVTATCNFTLIAAPGNTNLWEFLESLGEIPNPYVLCLSGGNQTNNFVMEYVTWYWTSTNTPYLTIQSVLLRSLCKPNNCEKQTIWIKTSGTVTLEASLTFINVTLSGRHFFDDTCSEDWCAHCLDVSLLVQEAEDVYHTVIDRHYVNLADDDYFFWQDRCNWGTLFSLFYVKHGSVFTFIDCTIEDFRYKKDSFVSLTGGTLILTRTKIMRTDTQGSFIQAFDFYDPLTLATMVIEDCWVSGLNRDHAYYPGYFLDRGFLEARNPLNLTISGSVFEDNLVLGTSSLIEAKIYQLKIENTVFRRCTGHIKLNLLSLFPVVFSNVTFAGHFAEEAVLQMGNSESEVLLRGCTFSASQSHSGMLSGPVTKLENCCFRDNRMLSHSTGSLVDIYASNLTILNCTFENNGPLDSTYQLYWTRYYLSNGLLNDNGLSAEEAHLQSSSGCVSSVVLRPSLYFSAANLLLSEKQLLSTCDITLTVYCSDPVEGLLHNVRFHSRASMAFIAFLNQGTLSLQNSLLESAAELMLITATDSRTQFFAENVTFQYATGNALHSVATLISGATCSFKACRWLHNQGWECGGLLVLGSVTLEGSQFLNNSCWAGAGDLQLHAQGSGQRVSNCSFTDSRSATEASSILLLGEVEDQLVISDCQFQGSSSDTGAVLQVAHSSGTVILRNLLLFDIHSLSTILISISPQISSSVLPTSTLIEGLQVRNSSFYQGIALQTGSGQLHVTSVRSHFVGNTGTVFSVSSGNFTDLQSLYEFNTAPSGFYSQGNGTFVSFTSCLYLHNFVSGAAALISVEGSASVTHLLHCVFESNLSPDTPLVQISQNAAINFRNCSFGGNSALGALLFVRDAFLSLHSCVFTGMLSVLKMEDARAEVLFTDIAGTTSSAVKLARSDLVMQQSSLRHLSGQSCVLSGRSSNVLLVQVQLEDLSCSTQGFALSNSSFTLTNSTITRVSTHTTTGLSVSQGVLILSHLVICSIHTSNSFVSLLQAAAQLTNVTVTDSSAQLLDAMEASIFLDTCHFTEISTSQSSGILTCSSCSSIIIENCLFNRISASIVAAVSASASSIVILTSTWTHLHGRVSGALRLQAPEVQIFNSTFLNISASSTDSQGGAVFLETGQAVIKETMFAFCSAYEGGAIYRTLGSLQLFHNAFQNNSAFYGNNVASFPAYFWVASRGSVLVSGQKYEGVLEVYVKDDSNETIVTDYSTSALLSSSAGLSGKVQTEAVAGVLRFTGFTITSTPGQPVEVLIATADTSLSAQLSIQVRLCEVGEMQNQQVCTRCPASTYSLTLSSLSCSQCPVQAECTGGSKIYPNSGYWRPDIQFPGILSCPRPESCLGSEERISETGLCAELYTGNMCQSCTPGARREGRDRCVLCPETEGIHVQAAFQSAGLLGLWLLVAWASSGMTGVYLRTLLNYLQLMVLVADFDLKWPDPLLGFFALHQFAGNAVQNFLPLDCLYSQAVYIATLAAVLCPVVIAAFLAVIWTFFWLLYRALGLSFSLKDKFVSSLIVAWVYVHPFVLRISLSSFQCTPIKPEQEWLRSEMSSPCWDQKHLAYALAASLPSVLLWGVGLPVLAILLLQRQRRQPAAKWHSLTDYLCGGFSNRMQLWEVATVLFKALVAGLYVASANTSVPTQSLSLVLVLSLGMLCQYLCAPFKDRTLNQVSLWSLGVTLATAFCGLCFSLSSSHPALVAFLLALHLVFAFIYIYAAWRSRLQLLIRRIIRKN